MNCLVGSPIDDIIESKSTTVEYWYGIETSAENIYSFRYDLESAIYHEAMGSVSWCSERRLQEARETFTLGLHGRRLGIMAISSAPMDVLWSNSEYSSESRPYNLK